MNTFQQLMRSIVEPFLTCVIGVGIVLVTLWFIEPRYFTQPSHYMPNVPDRLIINEVNEMIGCHERVKKYIMSAGELREQDINPNVTIMFCGDK